MLIGRSTPWSSSGTVGALVAGGEGEGELEDAMTGDFEVNSYRRCTIPTSHTTSLSTMMRWNKVICFFTPSHENIACGIQHL